MAKGQEAKNLVIEKIKEAFGDDFIGEYGGKYYLWSREEGQRKQVCVSLTCPKNNVGEVDMTSAFGDGIDFTAAPAVAPPPQAKAEITPEEQANIAELMARLGL